MIPNWLERPKTIPPELKRVANDLYEFHQALFPCVYFLIENEKVVYVGQSINLASRLKEHSKTKSFERVLYVRVEPEDLDTIERLFIMALNPPLNIKAPPQGSICSELMLDSFRERLCGVELGNSAVKFQP